MTLERGEGEIDESIDRLDVNLHGRNYNDAMFAVRYVGLVALVIWVGGMAVLSALVSPVTWQALEAADPAGGRILAGVVFGDVLRLFHLLAYACGVVVLTSLLVMKFVGPPPSWFATRSAIAALMLAVMVYSGFSVTPELAEIQKDSTDRVHAPDSPIARFEALRRRSVTVMTIDAGLGLVLLLWYVREGAL
jgi:uncharacterized membrane protein